MADAGRDQHRVADPDAKRGATVAAEANLRLAARDAEHVVGGRMVVMEREDAVPPGMSPAVRPEEGLEGAGGIAARCIDGSHIDDQRQAGIVRDVTVVGEQMRGRVHG